MDDKPLRHEDYLAMAEENRRLTEENNKLRNPNNKSHKIDYKGIIGAALALFVLIGGYVALIMSGGPKPQIYPCYFIAHDYKSVEPWDRWYLFKVNEEDGKPEASKQDNSYVSFFSKDEADIFYRHWKLKECK